MKKLIILSMVAMFAGACGVDAEGACEDFKEACKDDATFGAGVKDMDCADSQKDYDEATDKEKEKADEMIECMDDVDECAAKVACAMKAEVE